MKKLVSLIIAIGFAFMPSMAIAAQSSRDITTELTSIADKFSVDGVVISDSETSELSQKTQDGARVTLSSSFQTEAGKTAITLSPADSTTKLTATEDGTLLGAVEADTRYLPRSQFGNMQIIARTYSATETSLISYNIGLQGAAHLIELGTGDYQIMSADEEYLGTLERPWAIDSNGTLLETNFELTHGLLEQTINVDENTAYPVTSDPSWTYSVDLGIHSEAAVISYYSYRSPAYVTNLLKKCFNCYFPNSGAPVTYPYVGQYMPLKIQEPMFYWAYKDAPVSVTTVYTYGWRFIALPGHVDGADSTISFVWYQDSNLRLHLSVVARVMNPDPCGTGALLCQPLYVQVATGWWQKLFNNVT